MVGLVAWFACGCAGQNSAASAARARGFDKKIIWVWGPTRKTPADAVRETDLCRSLGYNVMVIDGPPQYIKDILPIAHERKMQVWVLVSWYGEWGFPKLVPNVPKDMVQQFPPDELAGLAKQTNPDKPVHPGPFLCFDRPEVRKYAAELAIATVQTYHPDGLAVDWVGYRNYRACHCAYSNQQRARYASEHPDLSPEQAQRDYSLTSMAAVYEVVRQAAKAADPNITIGCHVYPQFDPEPLCGNRFAVDYPAQTTAWFFQPFWPMEKVAENARTTKATEHKYHDYVTGTGFIGMTMEKPNIKSPERLRQEIRTIKAAGLKAICFAGDGFYADPALAQVISEEIGGTYRAPAAK